VTGKLKYLILKKVQIQELKIKAEAANFPFITLPHSKSHRLFE
jgi:hypothetical protein